MQEIFDKIKGRQWDWFGCDEIKEQCFINFDYTISIGFSGKFSLADLLSNPSWCKTVWGEEERIKLVERIVPEQKIVSSIYGETLRPSHKIKRKIKLNWEKASCTSFKILQQEGHDAAIEYIKSTMA